MGKDIAITALLWITFGGWAAAAYILFEVLTGAISSAFK
jgi:hypothetical protein